MKNAESQSVKPTPVVQPGMRQQINKVGKLATSQVDRPTMRSVLPRILARYI